MALTAGTRIGPYEVISPLGAGGMGEGYRARDSRLNRDVALKVLPDAFARDSERLARFKREAQVLAALNHPHIAAIYEIEEADGVQALVLELVEGPTLADRIASGRILLDEALPIARQIADALEAAHEQGIVHRDLKPANIKITPDGVVKVLDFGLARAGPTEAGHYAPDATALPTITSPAMMTSAGTILGTAAYMSPEQAKGRTADKRSDVWGFGCVLYEMLTGKRAFDGTDMSDTMAAVLRAEPDWTIVPSETPRAVQRLLRSCLQKDRKQRIPDIAIARFEIDETLSAPHDGPGTVDGRRRPRWQTLAATAALVIVACALTGIAVSSYLRPEAPRVTRFDIAPSGIALFTSGPAGVNLVVSPDGRQIVYHVRRGVGALELRRFDQLESQTIAGTEDATHPAFSPDGRTLVFVKDRKLQKLASTPPPACRCATCSTWPARAGSRIPTSCSRRRVRRVGCTVSPRLAANRNASRRRTRVKASRITRGRMPCPAARPYSSPSDVLEPVSPTRASPFAPWSPANRKCWSKVAVTPVTRRQVTWSTRKLEH